MTDIDKKPWYEAGVPILDPLTMKVKCPICQSDYVHPHILLGGAIHFERGWMAEDGYAMKLQADCENGHSWTMCLGFTHGHTTFWIEKLPDEYNTICPRSDDDDPDHPF